jgi:hypothetical protein
MNSDALYKNIGFVAVVVLFLYIVNKVVKLQNNAIEGFANKPAEGSSSSTNNKQTADDVETAQKEKLNTLKDKESKSSATLDIKKNKQLYYDILFSHYNNTHYDMTNMILANAVKITQAPDSVESQQMMTKLNTMKEYAATLEHMTNFFDDVTKNKQT